MGNKLVEELDTLVNSGYLQDYKLGNIDEFGLKDKASNSRNGEYLELVFPGGKKLELQTFCSGYLQNSCFLIGENNDKKESKEESV